MTARDRRVLVVDDSHAMRVFVGRLLELDGAARVDVAEDIDAATAVAIDRVYDLLVIDLQLTDGDGYEMLARLRAAGHAAPALAITADPTPETRDRCDASGFGRCLGKPFSRDDLSRAIGELLGPGRPAKD